ncbi:hypothetical protein [Nocardia sp. NPDC049526]|uniref:hypothetical protein n=1 Tax=Nocardia sp. NPDC049526 TaxID=3364316 RepID=UPI00379FB570
MIAPLPPDSIPTDQAADLFIGDRRVGDDRQQLVQQGLRVLTGAAAFGQFVFHPLFGIAEFRMRSASEPDLIARQPSPRTKSGKSGGVGLPAFDQCAMPPTSVVGGSAQ